MKLGGQEVEFKSGELRFNIREPFYSAGKWFGWEGNTLGIGINEDILNFAKKHDCLLIITVGDSKQEYLTTPKAVENFCEQYKSYYKIKGVKLYIIQWARLIKLGDFF